MNIKYSTFEDYTLAVMEEIMNDNIELPVKTDDFLPYADKEQFFWTGFYTSRPNFKYFIR